MQLVDHLSKLNVIINLLCNSQQVSRPSPNVKLRLRFDIHLTT